MRDSDAGAVFQVVEEYFFHPLVEFLAVDKYVALEIVFHAPEVEVGGAGGDKLVVDDDG